MVVVSICQVLVGGGGFRSCGWEQLLPVVDVSQVDIYIALKKPNAYKARGRPICILEDAVDLRKLYLSEAIKNTIWHRRNRCGSCGRSPCCGGRSCRGCRRGRGGRRC